MKVSLKVAYGATTILTIKSSRMDIERMCRCCCSGEPSRAQLLKKTAWLLHLINNNAPPAALDSSEVARTLSQSCYPHTGNGGHRWCLSSSLSLSAGFSIHGKAMDVARSAPWGAHYHADVIYLLI